MDAGFPPRSSEGKGGAIGDGRSHWFKGVQLITLYLVMAMMFYFLPVSH